MEHHLVLRIIVKLLIPLVLLFAFYVQFHGDYGPGGGFQAGVIFAAAFILYGLIFGMDKILQIISIDVLSKTAALGLLLYIGVGVATLVLGGGFLDYNVLVADPVSGQHLGILLIELGVGVTVGAVMVMLFIMFMRDF